MAMCWGGVGEPSTQPIVCNACAPDGHLSLTRHYHQPVHDMLEVKQATNAEFVHGHGRGDMGGGIVTQQAGADLLVVAVMTTQIELGRQIGDIGERRGMEYVKMKRMVDARDS